MIGFHVGRFLCWVGLHRFVWDEQVNAAGTSVTSYFRCQRGCPRYMRWTAGNIDRIRTPEGPA